MSTENKSGCALLLITLALLLFFGTGGWYVQKQYKTKQKSIQAELDAIEPFDEKTAQKNAADELGFPYPVPPPTMTPQEIRQKAEKEAMQAVKKAFKGIVYAKKQAEILKKYKTAKSGDTVTFMLGTTGKEITGVYNGFYTDAKGRYIKVDFHEYRLPDIMEDYLYLFVDGMAAKTANDKIRALKKAFEKQKKTFYKKKYETLLTEYYKKAGYSRKNGEWTKNIDIFNELLEKKRKQYEKDNEKLKKRIYEKNKLFGLIGVNLVEFNTADSRTKQSSK